MLKRAHLARAPRGSGMPGAVLRAIAAANRIAGFPYRYGGGHALVPRQRPTTARAPSPTSCTAPACSAARGTRASSYRGAQPGRGRWITVYANPGHAYMVINGKRYDTTGRWDTGSRWQRVDRSSAGYVARHPAGL